MTVLSSYVRSRPPQAFNDVGIVVLSPDGRLQEWTRGGYEGREAIWLQRLNDKQIDAAETALLASPNLLAETMQLERVYVAGRKPQGTPLGVVGGSLAWPTADVYYKSGWLAPESSFDGGPAWFYCSDYEHDELARALFKFGSIDAEREGWARVSDGVPRFGRGKEPTAFQAEFFLKHGA